MSRTAGELFLRIQKQLTEAMRGVAEGVGGPLRTASCTLRAGAERFEDGVGVRQLVLPNGPSAVDDRSRAMRRFDAPLQVANALDEAAQSGQIWNWMNMHPDHAEFRMFERWTAGPPDAPLPTPSADFGINCWEIPLYFAVRTG